MILPVPTVDSPPKTREEFEALTQRQAATIFQLEERLRWFEEQFRLNAHRQHGASSERFPSAVGQGNLFNEAEAIADVQSDPTEEEGQSVGSYTRKKRGRRPLPTNLPVKRIEYRLPEEEQVCSCCGGHLHEMSSESRTELEIVPAQASLVEHVRYVYSCRSCERNNTEVPIKVAEAPQPVIPKGLASPSALAYVIGMKFVEAVPLYRQEKHFENLGIPLSRAVLSDWVLKAADCLSPVYEAMKGFLIEQDVLHADETTLQVLHESGRAAQTKSYIWLYQTGNGAPPCVAYEYQATRCGRHPRSFLEGFTGYLQVDGYVGYEGIANATLVGCWAHARRKFIDALKALPVEARAKADHIHAALNYFRRLYRIEREIRDLSTELRTQARDERSRPVMEAFKRWLDNMVTQVLPKSKFGGAVRYCLNQWPKLVRVLEDGRLELDNNRAERSIKPFVIGRKNWLFSVSPRGARASALLYSIVVTAKENGLNPYAYLTYVLTQLPNLDPPNDTQAIHELLPWKVKLPANTYPP